MFKSIVLGASSLVLSTSVNAAVIDFNAFSRGVFVSGVEDGFTISAVGGKAYVDDFSGAFGNPGNGFFNDSSSALNSVFTFVNGTTFTFDSLDIKGGTLGGSHGSITVRGFLGGTLQQADVFSTRSFYRTVNSSLLSGLEIDRLSITLPKFGITADNVSFGEFVPATVPVPAAVWLFGSGLIGLIGMARRKSITLKS